MDWSENSGRRFKAMKSTAILCLVSASLCAHPSVTPGVISQVIQIESSGRASVLGDSGAARGLAQFQQAAWQDCSAWRSARGLPVFPYASATHPDRARAYLHSWLTLNADRFQKATGRSPTGADLYAIHNLGFNGFAQREFDLSRCPPITRRKAAQMTQR